MKKILLSIFLSTIFMANVVAMAGTCDDYNIETRNDNGVEVYSVLENDECNRDEAMAEILRLTGDPSYTQQPSLFRASDPLYKNNQGYHGTTTAYGSVYIIMMIILTMCLKVDNLRCGLALAHVIR